MQDLSQELKDALGTQNDDDAYISKVLQCFV